MNQQAQKAFNIIANFELQIKPSWLDEFRLKYDHPYQYHVTLKNTTFIQAGNEDQIQSELKEFISDWQPIEITFSDVIHNLTSRGECIMINYQGNKDTKIHQYQKQIHDKFSKYGSNIKQSYQDYETTFQPHITIGRYISPENFTLAWKEIESYNCKAYSKALIDSISLTFVNAQDEKEIPETRRRIDFRLA